MARAWAATVRVSLSPASIPADGVSQSAITVTLSPALPAQWIVLSAPFDPHISFGPIHDNGDGTYTATLTGSRSAEVTQIFAATQSGVDEVFPATLTQVGASATSVAALTTGPALSSNPPVTNQGVVLLATVTPLTDNLVAPSGTVSFQNGSSPIAGCQSLPLPPHLTGTEGVTCNTSFAATSSPAAVTAVFSPGGGSLLGPSTSRADAFPVNRDSTSTSLGTASAPAVGAAVTYVARVKPDHAGAAAPTGFVAFSDNGTSIASCGQRPLDAAMTATCTVTYERSGPHAITASYDGDGNFAGSDSTALDETIQPLGTIDASLQWRFLYTRAYTQVLQLVLTRATTGSRVSISCHGRMCPFGSRAVAIRAGKQCRRISEASCAAAGTVDLTPRIGQVDLRRHTRLVVSITKPGWTGKTYRFTVRAGLPPTVRIDPVPPGPPRD